MKSVQISGENTCNISEFSLFLVLVPVGFATQLRRLPNLALRKSRFIRIEKDGKKKVKEMLPRNRLIFCNRQL